MEQERTEERTDGVASLAHMTTDTLRRAAGAFLLPPILRTLTEGQPAPVDRIGTTIGLPSDLVAPTVSFVFPDAEFDADGRLLGLGLSLVPTPHVVRLAGHNVVLYGWCAPDALVLPTLIAEGARITSPCAATGQPISIGIEPEGVREVRPASAVVAFLTEADPRHLRATVCIHQNFFASADVAAPWLAEHPRAAILPVAEGFRRLTDRYTGASLGLSKETVALGDILGRLAIAQLRADGQQLDELICRLVAKEGGSLGAATNQPEPGDVWWDPEFAGWLDSEAHRARGGGPHLIIRLPNGWDWDLDAPMTNGSGWWRSGEPPNVSAFPSVIADDYHGFLLRGRLFRLGGALPHP